MAVLQIILLRSCRLLYALSCLMLSLALAFQAVLHQIFPGSHFCTFLICLAIWVPQWYIHIYHKKKIKKICLTDFLGCNIQGWGGNGGRSCKTTGQHHIVLQRFLLQLEGRISFLWKRTQKGAGI